VRHGAQARAEGPPRARRHAPLDGGLLGALRRAARRPGEPRAERGLLARRDRLGGGRLDLRPGALVRSAPDGLAARRAREADAPLGVPRSSSSTLLLLRVRNYARTRSDSGVEVATLLEVGDETRLRRPPPEDLLRARARGRDVQCEGVAEEAEERGSL